MSWRDARRVLAVRLDAVGDVLMTTPALRALEGAAPGRHLTLLTSSAGAAVGRLVPEVDDVLVYDPPWMKAASPRGAGPDHATIARLRAGRFDAAVIFTVYSQSALPAALVCFLAGIPLRLAHTHENPYQLLTDWVPDPEPARRVRHEARRQLDLVAAVGATTADERLSLAVPVAAQRRARRCLAALGLDTPDRWLLLHPGASAPSRRYPVAAFIEVAGRLAERTGRSVLVAGGADDRALADAVCRGVGGRARSVAGRFDLGGFAALVAAAPVLITNNSGPVHVAAAVGTPVVDLYALTNPQHTPWRVRHRVLFQDVPCRFCYKSVCPESHHACLAGVSPERVVDATLDLLAEVKREPTAVLAYDPPLAGLAPSA